MEHILQFGINIDDEAIKKLVMEKASDMVVKETKRELGIEDGGYYHHRGGEVEAIVNKVIQQVFNEHKDEIIEVTSKKLADKLVRTKAVKEATQAVLGEVLGE